MMAAPTVKDLLDLLASDSLTIDQVAEEFASRSWPTRPTASNAEFWGVTDNVPPGDNDWKTVDEDPRLTGDQYARLAAAHVKAVTA